jgi:hypothetical protein
MLKILRTAKSRCLDFLTVHVDLERQDKKYPLVESRYDARLGATRLARLAVLPCASLQISLPRK